MKVSYVPSAQVENCVLAIEQYKFLSKGRAYIEGAGIYMGVRKMCSENEVVVIMKGRNVGKSEHMMNDMRGRANYDRGVHRKPIWCKKSKGGKKKRTMSGIPWIRESYGKSGPHGVEWFIPDSLVRYVPYRNW